MTSPDYARHFSVRNIPFGIASSARHPGPQAVTRLENTVIFLHECHATGLFDGIDGLPDGVFRNSTLNEFAALSKPVQKRVREAIQATYQRDNAGVTNFPESSVEDILQVQMHMPVSVGDFAGRCSVTRVHSQLARSIHLLIQHCTLPV